MKDGIDSRTRMLIRKKHEARLAKYNAAGSHTKTQFYALCKRQQWRCHYCRKKLTKDTVTEDHVRALSNGGSDNMSNIVPACHSCNSRKGTKDYGAFMQEIRTGKKA